MEQSRAMTKQLAWVAWAAAIGGVFYGIAFVFLKSAGLAASVLMVGGLAGSVIISALGYDATKVNSRVARWATNVGVFGALVSVIHGGYDLARVIHPPAPGGVSLADLPNQVDPRGLATFGLTGFSYLVVGGLLRRHPAFPGNLARMAQGLGLISVVIYFGRLVILEPTNPVVRVALALGVVTAATFFVMLARHWSRR